MGVSPDCADIKYSPGVPGSVGTRPGLTLQHTFPFNLESNYLTSYVDEQGNAHSLYLNSDGSLWDEYPQGTFTEVSVDQQFSGSYAKSCSAYGSEFIGFSDGKFGLNIPRRYRVLSEGNSFDRLSQVGPGAAPSVTDYVVVQPLRVGAAAMPTFYNISSISMVGNLVTVTVAGTNVFSNPSRAYQVGDLFQIKGTTNFNGEFPIAQILSPSSAILTYPQANSFPTETAGTCGYDMVGFFTVSAPVGQLGEQCTVSGVTDPTYDTGGGNPTTWEIRGNDGSSYVNCYVPSNSGVASNSSGGVLTIVGNISAGVHQVSVCFITRNGYITEPAPPGSWTAMGGLAALVSGIPYGPPNVIARLLVFTTSGGANFFYSQANTLGISTFLIPDNSSTTAIVDFTDLALLSAISADLLFDRFELPPCAAIINYAERIFPWGVRNLIPNFVNMSFDGGAIVQSSYPLGWTQDITPSGDGGSLQNSTMFGFDYVIDNNAPGIRGRIYQNANQDYLGVAILSPLTNYSLRVSLKQLIPNYNGTFTADIYDTGSSTVLATAIVNLGLVEDFFKEFIVQFNTEMPVTIPTGAVLRLYANYLGTGSPISVKNVSIFPNDEPFQASQLLASNVQDPEAFQGVTGFLNVNENDGHRITSLCIIRDRLYIAKNISGLFVTSDDPTNEPDGWTIDTISRRVGCESINGMGTKVGDTGEDWFFILAREGLYIFWSSEPPKVSQEIQPTWELINWDYAYLGWVQVDTANRRVLVGLPIGATTPNKVYMMDYQQVGATGESVASGSPVAPNYAGQVKAHTTARKWSIWNMQANACGFLERSDGQAHLTIALNTNAPSLIPSIYQIDDSALDDAGVAIPGGGYYLTAFYLSDEQKASFQMKGNRCLQRYATLFVQGQGELNLETFGPGYVNSASVPQYGAPALTLTNPASQDMEIYTNFTAERIANKITASAAGETNPNWSVQNMQLYVAPDLVSPVRGSN